MSESEPGARSMRPVLIVIATVLVVGGAWIAGDLLKTSARLNATPTTTPVVIDGRTRTGTAVPATSNPAGQTPAAVAQVAPTRFIVTPEPPPQDVFEAATRVAAATARVGDFGPATAAPPNMITATFTPKPLVVTPTPSPANAATAEFRAAWATAVAFTTGTPTPPPGGVVVATATPGPRPTDVTAPVDLAARPSPTAAAVPPELVGKILFLSNLSGRNLAYAIEPDGTGLVQLTADWPLAAAARRDAWSADKVYRAYAARDLESGQTHIHVAEAGGETIRQIADAAGTAPVWSPTGNTLAYVSTQGGNEDVWIVGADGAGREQLTANKWPADQHPSWSPDGRQIVFTSNRTGKRQLWIMNADGSDPQPLTGPEYEAWDPVWVKFAH